jgi:hypothetical protein
MTPLLLLLENRAEPIVQAFIMFSSAAMNQTKVRD